jgi:pyrroline-5-carboxylate reductase
VKKLSEYVVYLVGCGQMGTALIQGALDSGRVQSDRLVCIKHGARSAAFAASTGAHELAVGHAPGVLGPRLILVAVKPQDVAAALSGFEFREDDVVVSVAAGVTVAQLAGWCGPAQIVRSMPNTPSLIGKGVTGVFSETPCGAAIELFDSVGVVAELKSESLFGALTGISGCGPAYVFMILEALADGGVKMGLDRATARKIAAATVEGAAALATASTAHTAELKDRVASPGGATIAALAYLESQGVRSAFIGAVETAATRSALLGEKLS